MERVIFVEILDRGGSIVRRERVTALPLRIGRSYSNDLILDDPHVCPAHALLELREIGDLVLRDLGSRNGVRALPRGERVNELRVVRGAAVQLGRTVLRFHDADDPVPEALHLRGRPRWFEWVVTAPAAALAWLLALAAVGLLELWITATAKVEWVGLFSAAGVGLLVTLVWAGAWALLTRLLTRRSRFVAHLAIAAVALIATTLQDRMFQLGQFVFEAIDPLQIANLAGHGLVLALAVFGHLSVMLVGRPLRRWAAACSTGLVLFGLLLGSHYQDTDDWVVVLPYWSRLEPISTSALPIESLDDFFRDASGIEGELAELREQEPATR